MPHNAPGWLIWGRFLFDGFALLVMCALRTFNHHLAREVRFKDPPQRVAPWDRRRKRTMCPEKMWSSWLLFLFAAGCSNSTPTSSGGSVRTFGTNEKGKPRIALIMKSLANEFFSTMAKGAQQHQTAHADQYDLVVNGIKDEHDLSRQVALVEEMVTSGVDAIVIAPADSRALVPALRRPKKQGSSSTSISPNLFIHLRIVICV